jgi:excisionase family DNA binding protein
VPAISTIFLAFIICFYTIRPIIWAYFLFINPKFSRMAFTIDRSEAAARLGVSSRTIDRHIQSDRIRTRRIGKKIFLEEDDVESLRMNDSARREEDYEIVIESDEPTHEIIRSREMPIVPTTKSPALTELVRLYEESRDLIARKDSTIQDLSYRLGQTETELKNSISMIEYKKATFMLESAKTKNDTDTVHLGGRLASLESELRKRNAAIITLALLFILVLGFSVVFFLYMRTL